jgi:hypothetical protein
MAQPPPYSQPGYPPQPTNPPAYPGNVFQAFYCVWKSTSFSNLILQVVPMTDKLFATSYRSFSKASAFTTS